MRPARMVALGAALMITTALCTVPCAAVDGGAASLTAHEAALARAPVAIAYTADITVRPDRTLRKVTTLRLTVQTDAAVQNAGQQRLTYVDGMETLQILESYTEKQDGRRIPIGPDNIISGDAASGAALVFLRDQKARTVIFPDVAVGDTIVLQAAYEKTRDFFPGEFAEQFLFARTSPYREAKVTITAPSDLALQIGAFGEGLERTTSESDGITRHEVVYRPAPLLAAEPGATSEWDRDARVMISTLEDYSALGRHYWAEASTRATVTPDIQALADTITDGIGDRRAQAEAIDTWIKRNIRYVAVYMGAGRWVPHAATDVLKARYGDCKDHAILLTALLAAKGIGSEQVLINLGNAYALPEIPTHAVLNHAMVYIPEFDLYDDPTGSFDGFGVLSANAYDKPVVHAGPNGGRVGHTPTMRAEDHTTFNRTTITIASDGTMRGETTQTATGGFAAALRGAATNAKAQGLEAAAEGLLEALGTPGKGRYEVVPIGSLSEPYRVKVSFTYDQRMAMPLQGGRDIPFGAPVQKRAGEFLLNARQETRRRPFQCFAGRQIEEISLTFADGLPMPQKMTGRTIESDVFSYVSTYRIEGRTFTVRREFTSRVAHQACAPQLEVEMADDLKMLRASMTSKLMFSPPVSRQDTATQKAAETPVSPATTQVN